MEREPYPSDLSDEQWALIEPMITAWKQDRVSRSATGDPGSCDLREVVNVLLYQNRTGCQWHYLPHDLPTWSAVFYYFTLWRKDGLDQRIQEILRCQVRERSRRLGRVLKVVHDGVDLVSIERSLVVDPVLKHALRHLRSVKSQQPSDADSVEFADWRERIAEALDALACVLVFEEDRVRARAEAAVAREQAAEVRRQGEIRASER